MRNSRLRAPLRLFTGTLLLVLGWIWWQHLSRPEIGGGVPESFVATWVKNRIYATVSASEERGFERLTAQNANGWHGLFREPIQSFDWYRSNAPMRPTSQRRVMVLQPIGPMNEEHKALLLAVSQNCAAWFGLPVRIEAALPLNFVPLQTRPSRIPSRKGGFWSQPQMQNQIDAGSVVAELSKRLPPDAAAYLGVTMADLWSGDLGYVFGLGSFQSRCGVYSFARYFPEFWNRRRTISDETLILRRSCAVLNHEAGHLFGLEHCVLYRCAMNGSNSLPDADRTPLEPCPICARKLQWNTGFDPLRRKRELLEFYRRFGMRSEVRALQATSN